MKKLAIVLASFSALTACASSTDTEGPEADRTVVIYMQDNHFEPDELEVRQGQTVAIRFVNRGSVRHDAFIGDADAQEDHEREARMADEEGEHDGGHGTDEESAITLEPGGRDTLSYRFDRRGEILIGCHEAGHYDRGMVVRVDVT